MALKFSPSPQKAVKACSGCQFLRNGTCPRGQRGTWHKPAPHRSKISGVIGENLHSMDSRIFNGCMELGCHPVLPGLGCPRLTGRGRSRGTPQVGDRLSSRDDRHLTARFQSDNHRGQTQPRVVEPDHRCLASSSTPCATCSMAASARSERLRLIFKDSSVLTFLDLFAAAGDRVIVNSAVSHAMLNALKAAGTTGHRLDLWQRTPARLVCRSRQCPRESDMIVRIHSA